MSVAAALGWWVLLSIVAFSALASLGAWARHRRDAQGAQELRKAARAYGTMPESENHALASPISKAGHPRGRSAESKPLRGAPGGEKGSSD